MADQRVASLSQGTLLLAVPLAALVACSDAESNAVSQLRGELISVQMRLDSLASAIRMNDAIRDLQDTKMIDLRETTLQEIGHGFETGNLSVHSEPGATRIAGTIVNELAIGHESAKFRITVRGQSKEFTIMNVPGGGSGRFSVSVFGVRADSVRFGTIEYVESTVRYHVSQ